MRRVADARMYGSALWEIREQAIHEPKLAASRREVSAAVEVCRREVRDKSVQAIRGTLERDGFTVASPAITTEERFVAPVEWRGQIHIIAPSPNDTSYEIVRHEFSQVLKIALPVTTSAAGARYSGKDVVELPLHILVKVSRVAPRRAARIGDVKDVTEVSVTPLFRKTEGVAIPETATVLDDHVSERPVTMELRYAQRVNRGTAAGSHVPLSAVLASIKCAREIDRLPADLADRQKLAAQDALAARKNPLPAIYRTTWPSG